MRLLLMLNYNVLPAASHDVVYTGPLHYTVVDHEQYTCSIHWSTTLHCG